jgi:hypothetical protein
VRAGRPETSLKARAAAREPSSRAAGRCRRDEPSDAQGRRPLAVPLGVVQERLLGRGDLGDRDQDGWQRRAPTSRERGHVIEGDQGGDVASDDAEDASALDHRDDDLLGQLGGVWRLKVGAERADVDRHQPLCANR